MASLLLSVQTHVRVNPPSEGIEFVTPSTLRLSGNPTPFTVSHVHKMPETLQGPSNREFYRKSLSGMVEACLAGQSFTVMFCSAPNCGRSHTLYGGNLSGGEKEKGIIELMAGELLDRKDVMLQAASFSVIGDELFQTTNAEKRVEIKEFAPPIGVLTTATMFPVESPAQVRLLPPKKNVLATYVTQLFVAHPLEGAPSLRSTYSVISFVDLPGFVPSLITADVQSLILSVERAAKGSDPLFGQCKLTKLLENSISSSRTLVAVATVSGRREASEGNTAVMQFLEKVARLRQVTTLVQLMPPRFFSEAIRGIQEVRDNAIAQLQEAQQSGYAAVFSSISSFLRSVGGQVPAVLTRTDEGVAAVRKEMRMKFDEQALLLQAQLQDGKKRHDDNLQRAQQQEDDPSLMQEIAAERKLLHQKEDEISKGATHLRQIDASGQLQRDQLQNRHQKSKEAVEGCRRQKESFLKTLKGVTKKKEFVAGRAFREQRKVLFQQEKEETVQKKQRCEGILAAASVAAKTANSVCRDERERRSKVARLTQAEERVNVLRHIVEESASAAPCTPSRTPLRPPSVPKSTGRPAGTSASPAARRQLPISGMHTPQRTPSSKRSLSIAESPKTSRTPTSLKGYTPVASPHVSKEKRSTSSTRFIPTGSRTPTQPGIVNANRKRQRDATPSHEDPSSTSMRVKGTKAKKKPPSSASANKKSAKKRTPTSRSAQKRQKSVSKVEEDEEIIGIAARRRADQAAAISLF